MTPCLYEGSPGINEAEAADGNDGCDSMRGKESSRQAAGAPFSPDEPMTLNRRNRIRYAEGIAVLRSGQGQKRGQMKKAGKQGSGSAFPAFLFSLFNSEGQG
jgi:hypothetical protein